MKVKKLISFFVAAALIMSAAAVTLAASYSSMSSYYGALTSAGSSAYSSGSRSNATYGNPGRTYSSSSSSSRSSRSSSSSSSSTSGTVTGSFADMGGGGGGYDPPEPVCEDYTSDVSAPDFKIVEVVPLVLKLQQKTLIGVNVQNIGTMAGSTDVTVKIGSNTITMTDVKVPANGNHCLSFGYITATVSGTPTVTVLCNTAHPTAVAPKQTTCNTCGGCNYSLEYGSKGTLSPAEYDYTNNTWSGTIKINALPEISTPDSPAPEPSDPRTFVNKLPVLEISDTGGWGATLDTYTTVGGATSTLGNNRTVASWTDSLPTGADKLYSAKATMTAAIAPTSLKSGYGFTCSVTVKVTTDYPTTDKVEAPKKVIMYIPEWQYAKAVELVRTDSGGAYARTTTWELPVNTSSGTGAKKWYIPAWWPDNSNYIVLVSMRGVYTPGGELTASYKQSIVVDSNMYTDDYTTN